MTAEPLQLCFKRSWSRRNEHQSQMSVTLRNGTVDDGVVNVRDLARSVMLFFVSEQMMADKIGCENF